MSRLHLDERTGWPSELRLLLERYPREVWPGHANLGQTAAFWLKRHDMFRELGGALQSATHALKEGSVEISEFKSWFVPRLQFFLTELNAHHHIEDHSYFPVFRLAEPRLLRGFEVLEEDHEHIHERLALVADAANALLKSANADAVQRTVIHYATVSETLLNGLLSHLRDEEDLIVPVILDQTEEGLGL